MSVMLGFQDEEVKAKDLVDWSSNKFGGFPVSFFQHFYYFTTFILYFLFYVRRLCQNFYNDTLNL